MDIKKILKHIDGVEGKQKRHQQLNEAASMVINGDHADDVGIILDRLRGISTPQATTQAPNMRNDMDKFISAMGPREPSMMDMEPEDTADDEMGDMPAMPGEMPGSSIGDKRTGNEEWANEPDEKYSGHEEMIRSGNDMHKKTKEYPPVAGGGNPMTVETIKARLLKALAEANKRPDYPDVDDDGDRNEPLEKAFNDKETKESTKPQKGKVPPQFAKKSTKPKTDKMPPQFAKKKSKD